jgi:hypothetical protein
MSEPFTFDVAYTTTFSDLEKLREKMLAFLQNEKEKRYFRPIFDISIKGLYLYGFLFFLAGLTLDRFSRPDYDDSLYKH